MSVTVDPQNSIAAAGSTVSLTCTSTASSPRWQCSGFGSDFNNGSFSSTSSSPTTLTFTVNPSEPSDRLNMYHWFTVSDGSSSVTVEVYVVASGITSDDIVIIYGSDGKAYLLTEDGSNSVQLSAAISPEPTIMGSSNAASVPASQFGDVPAAPTSGAGAGTVTCYVLNMGSLQTG